MTEGKPNEDGRDPKPPREIRIRPLEVSIPEDTLRPLHEQLRRVVAEHPELAEVVADMTRPGSEGDGPEDDR